MIWIRASKETAIKINFKIDAFVLLGITVLLLGAMVFTVLRLLDQSESHVKTVKDMKVELSTTTFQPSTDDTAAVIEQDLRSNPKRTVANYRNQVLSERSFKLLAKMKHLTNVVFCDCDFDPAHLRYLENLPLTFLDLSGNDVTDESMIPIGKIKTIQILKLTDTKCSGDCMVNFKDFKNLQILEMNGLDVDDEDLKWIVNCPIYWLSIAGSRITDAGCESLAKIVTLQKLDISRTKVSGVGLSRLKPLIALGELQMKDCDLNDADMATFAQFPRLEALHLNRCPVTDEGLMGLGKSKSLKSVMLVNCPNITKEGSAKFSKTFQKIGLGVHFEKTEFSKYKDFIPTDTDGL